VNWIWENRTWLFSGAGIAALTLLLWFVRRLRTAGLRPRSENYTEGARVENASLSGSPIASGSNISQTVQNIFSPISPTIAAPIGETHPTPDEIREHIKSLPPYGQLEAAENYAGLPVHWRMRLYGVDKEFNETCSVNMKVSLTDFLAIYCDVRTIDCPRLRVAKRGTPVEVSGVIERVQAEGLVITLRDARLVFLDE